MAAYSYRHRHDEDVEGRVKCYVVMFWQFLYYMDMGMCECMCVHACLYTRNYNQSHTAVVV